jgi:hypothetical protein
MVGQTRLKNEAQEEGRAVVEATAARFDPLR